MNRVWAWLFLPLFFLAGCGAGATLTPTPLGETYANSQLLATTAWLEEHLSNPDLRVVDVRPQSRFSQGHLPGAINLPVGRTDDPENLVPGEVVSLARWQEIVGSLGIRPSDVLVIYDDGNLMSAARLFWILDLYGHQRLSLLEGGYAKWLEEGRTVSKVVRLVQGPYDYAAASQPDKLATRRWVLDSLDIPDVVLLDVRSEAEYRDGHIPGAINIEWSRAITEGEVPVLRGAGELQAMYEAAGIALDKEIAVYCQTGYRAAHTYFVLRLLGYPKVRLYDGSWAEWGNDPSLPVEQ